MDVNTQISFLFNLHYTECWCNFMILLIIEAKYLTQQNLYCYKRLTNFAFNDSNILLWSLSDKLIHFGFGHAFWRLSIFQVEKNFTLTRGFLGFSDVLSISAFHSNLAPTLVSTFWNSIVTPKMTYTSVTSRIISSNVGSVTCHGTQRHPVSITT